MKKRLRSSKRDGDRVAFKVFVREERRKLTIPQTKLEKIAHCAFQVTGKEGGDISLLVCDDEYITKLNETYTKRSGPTDVLAFSMREGESVASVDKMLGDIVISMDTTSQQAEELGETLEEEFLTLFIHGLLHLLGFDHRDRREKSVMQEYARKIEMEVGKAV